MFGIQLITSNTLFAYWSICNTLGSIKHHIWLKSIGTCYIDLVNNPWVFALPTSLKPRFINLNIDLDSIIVIDTIKDSLWEWEVFNNLFRNNSSIGHHTSSLNGYKKPRFGFLKLIEKLWLALLYNQTKSANNA